MNSPSLQFFESRNGYGYYAPVGEVSLKEAGSFVSRGIQFALTSGIPRLLVDATGLTQDSPCPRLPIVIGLSGEWATVSENRVAAAVPFCSPHLIDWDRFGVQVATNLGMRTDVFTSQAEALEWLLSEQTSSVLKK